MTLPAVGPDPRNPGSIINQKHALAAADDPDIPGLAGKLMPFQKAGVRFALENLGFEENKDAKGSLPENAESIISRQEKSMVASYSSKTRGGILIADEPGLGKTIQAIAIVAATHFYPAVIVCPAMLKLNWQREAERWLPGRRVIVLDGRDPGSFLSKVSDYCYDIYIINYDILGTGDRWSKNGAGAWVKEQEASGWVSVLARLKLRAVVFDECHYLKGHKAARSKACKALARRIPLRLMLTGTPIINQPSDLIQQLSILGRLDDLGGFNHFAERYCGAEETYHGGVSFRGARPRNLRELGDKLRESCLIRRTKEEVLPELPAKRRTNIFVDLSNRAEYERADSAFMGWVDESGLNNESSNPAIQLTRIEKLKQIAAAGKLKSAVEWIESFLETGQKLVVFAHHVEIQKAVWAEFHASHGAARIFGNDSQEERQGQVDRFQNNSDCRLIVCSLEAGGLGITLTAASNVLFLELGWTPAKMEQAEDRLHRIGQKESVNCYYLLARGTVDEQIERLIEQKRGIVSKVIGGGQVEVSESVLKELMTEMKARAKQCKRGKRKGNGRGSDNGKAR